MNSGKPHFPRRGRVGAYHRSARFFQLSDLRTLRKCEKVAAVCFRVRASVIEFLLVQTRGGRWTFPKGNAEPGLTTAQAAALEAFEEAGVHGRMEEVSFATYARPKAGTGGTPARLELLVTAHLCEVLWLDPPQESGRNPTWFSVERAKRRLRENRSAAYGSELARVVDHAVARVKQLRGRLVVQQIPTDIELEDIRGNLPPFKALPPARPERRAKSSSED
jgi:8-oxo-dGTP pyrophosphatase MutT (NUDIX family)